jgi:methionyl-tRNA formyltransferase
MPTPKGSVRVKALLSRPGLGLGAPGAVLDEGLLVACGEGAVRLLRLQREGKNAQNADEFVRGLTAVDDLRLA